MLITMGRFCIPPLLISPPTLLATTQSLSAAVYGMLILSFVNYARFCYLVISDITEFLGIACFTVQKRDEAGVWGNPVSENGNVGAKRDDSKIADGASYRVNGSAKARKRGVAG